MGVDRLYYGDNLDILRRYLPDESVDLVYLDPPFNSNQDYNVLFAEQDGSQAEAQIKAFGDTWRWDQGAARSYQEVVERGGRVSEALQAFRMFLGENNLLAYLSMMAPRLIELRRVLKPSGSIYLHCDPTASHYLKILMDGIFGVRNFKNEILWRRSHPKGHAFTRFARNHDVILFYVVGGEEATWNAPYEPHDTEKADQQYSLRDPDGRRYQLTSLLNPNPDRPNLTYEFKGVTRVWRWTKERMLAEDAKGHIVVPRGGEGVPRFKRYLDEQEGVPVSDVWVDIEPVAGRERLGYPTQKPEALLERILRASSNPGDVVLDPFCGCGTAVVAAEALGRSWIGIDITHLAINLIRNRLRDTYGDSAEIEVIGEPVSRADAEALGASDPYQLQWWALGLVGARPVEQKKGADRGIDGRLFFHDDESTRTKRVVLSVKAGHATVAHVRDLRGVIEREGAAIGALISLQEPTAAMRTEAAAAGFYEAPDGSSYPRLQLLTIEALLAGKRIDMPRWHASVTFKKAPRARQPDHVNEELPF